MKMRIVQDTVCSKCGKVPAFERWSINRVLKTIKRRVLCGMCGKGLSKTQPKPFE